MVRYHAIALREIAEATRYYARVDRQLGVDFAIQFEKAVEAIASGPLRFEQSRPGIRRYLLDRFPYGVYYKGLSDGTIRIIAVKHHSRRPGLGMRRK